MTDYQQEKQERANLLTQLGLDISRHLPSQWHIDTTRDDEGERVKFTNGAGMGFSVTLDRSSNGQKINVSTWDWPTYKVYGRSYGESGINTETVYPRNLYDPQETVSNIGVSVKKSPQQIAADIMRRFLPEYERIWQRCKEKADAHQLHEDKQRKQWVEVCNMLGTNPQYNNSYSCDRIGQLQVENRNGSLQISGYVDVETIAALVELFKRKNMVRDDM